MTRAKYKFDPESLSFNKIRLGFTGWLLKLLKYFFAGVVLSIAFYMVTYRFFESPAEKLLRRDNEQLKLQYEILNNRLGQLAEVMQDLEERDDNIYRTVFEAEPIPKSIREAGIGGVNRYAKLEGYTNSELIISSNKRLDKLHKQIYIQSKSYDELVNLALTKEELLGAVPAIQPISNKDLTRTASGWGWRIHPIYKIRKFHYGIDFTASTGTDIYATGNGVIEAVIKAYRGYGNHVIVDHGYGFKSLYAHMHDFNVRPGQAVNRGDVIGTVGSSGTSTGPHLHYEILKGGEKVNPINYFFNDLNPEEYEQMIEISTNSGQTFD